MQVQLFLSVLRLLYFFLSPSCHPAEAGRRSRIDRGLWRCGRGRATADRAQDRRCAVDGIRVWADWGPSRSTVHPLPGDRRRRLDAFLENAGTAPADRSRRADTSGARKATDASQGRSADGAQRAAGEAAVSAVQRRRAGGSGVAPARPTEQPPMLPAGRLL
jgi:hypothetical protein